MKLSRRKRLFLVSVTVGRFCFAHIMLDVSAAALIIISALLRFIVRLLQAGRLGQLLFRAQGVMMVISSDGYFLLLGDVSKEMGFE